MNPQGINPSNEPTEGGKIVSASGPSEVVTTRTGDPIVATTGTTTAETEDYAARYIHSELASARRSLRMTQIGGTLLALGTLLYLGYITKTVQDETQPDRAAQTASGLIGARVTEQAETVAAQAKQQVPKLISGLPDYALKQMPGYREQLETQIDSDVNTNLEAASKQMDGHFDDFIGANKEQIASLLKDGNDKQATHQLAIALQGEFEKFLKETPTSSTSPETAKQKIDQTLVALQQVNTQLSRLAANKGLSPEEQKMRRAIAILSKNIHQGVADSGIKVAQNPM